MSLSNWSGNLVYSTDNVFYPETVEEIQRIVRDTDAVKIIGSGHSFNDISDSSHALVSLQNMRRILEIDTRKQTVTLEAGARYGDIVTGLHGAGYALHNLASLPHISVVGACATGTHGSGIQNGNLATIISALEFVSADGDLVQLSRENNPDVFDGIPVNLGALGLVTQVTLDIVPTYDVRQTVFVDVSLDEYLVNFEAVMSAGYSVSAFTHWQDNLIKQIWVKQKSDETPVATLLDQTPSQEKMHPIAGVSPENATEQFGKSGAWHDRLPHFRIDFTPSNGDELQSEYFIDRKFAGDAIQALYGTGDLIAPVLLVSEIRCIAADNLWLSPCYHQDSVAFHFTWVKDWEAVRPVLVAIESALEAYVPRPHWGKLFTMPADTICSRYEKFDDFQNLAQAYDPDGKFQNRYLKQLLDG